MRFGRATTHRVTQREREVGLTLAKDTAHFPGGIIIVLVSGAQWLPFDQTSLPHCCRIYGYKRREESSTVKSGNSS